MKGNLGAFALTAGLFGGLLFVSGLGGSGIAVAGQPELKMSKIIKVFSGPEGEEVAIANVEGGKQALIRYTGVEGEFEGKVFLHEVVDLGDRGSDYKMKYKGKDYVSITGRSSGGSRSYEVYLPERHDAFRIRYDDKKSKEAKADDLLSEYKKQNRK